MKKRKMVAVLTSFAVAASFCITSLGSVSTPVTADAATSSTAGRENGKKENVVEELSQDVELDDGVNIEIPMDLSFSIDPINLMEKGQIQSKEYNFKNNSDRDVRITLSEIYYTFSNDKDFRCLKSYDELNPYSETKDIYLYLENNSEKVKLETLGSQELFLKDFNPNIEEDSEQDIENADTYYPLREQKVVITDEVQYDACSFILSGKQDSSKSKISFHLNGAVSEFPDESWDNSDVEIHVLYSCSFVEDEKKKTEENVLATEEYVKESETQEDQIKEDNKKETESLKDQMEETGEEEETESTGSSIEEEDDNVKTESFEPPENGGTEQREEVDEEQEGTDIDVGLEHQSEESEENHGSMQETEEKQDSSENNNIDKSDGVVENKASDKNDSSEEANTGKGDSEDEKTI